MKNSKNISKLSQVDKHKIKHILVTRPNHRLGNLLLLSPLIQKLENEFPNSKIDLLVNGYLANIVFKNYTSIRNIYSLPKKPFKNLFEYTKTSYKLTSFKYDLAIVGDEGSNSSKIFVKLSRAKFKIFNSQNNNNLSNHISKRPIAILMSILYPKKKIETYPKLDIKLTEKEIEVGKNIYSSFFPNTKKTIALFTNATGNKKLSEQWWNTLSSKLESQFTALNILEILPKENISQLNFKYKSYLSDDIREMAAVIENCAVFIGADSGIMHLATTTNTPTFGLFNGVTDPEIYRPYGSFKYAFETNKANIEALILQIKNTLNTIE